ncbi:adenine phosphoribosyltransferase [Fulvivirga lutea]|uniref:Adenine phosphoribosyltransferase n=1 Tax=Fulvivirga lutea TaxID=2810512 RepID=A0A974WDQ1_9BACT|nr:adenine phosphoribosyltransferase [Fulvivirga lutea]QSE95986.1 adenine phosphoribosyltransferase [Fulvivirga lutea]
MNSLSEKLKAKIRDVENFPKPGITFKDITPVLSDSKLCRDITEELLSRYKDENLDAIVGVESRGFLFGMLLAYELNIPFVPVRKSGKLPFRTLKHSYDLEYGSASMEIHVDALQNNWNVLIHDDLLATGGTAAAAGALVEQLGAKVQSFSFLIDLTFLNGKDVLKNYTTKINSLVQY